MTFGSSLQLSGFPNVEVPNWDANVWIEPLEPLREGRKTLHIRAMDFSSIPLEDAQGAILAHSLKAGGRVLRKGARLSDADCQALAASGVTCVTAARLSDADCAEDEAAVRVARAAAGAGLDCAAPVNGRCNLHVSNAGVLRVNAAAIHAANAVDEALTIATPLDWTRLAAGQLAATAKIIPYAAPKAAVQQVEAALSVAPALTLHPFQALRVAALFTAVPGQKPSLLSKGIEAVRKRIESLGSTLNQIHQIAHDEAALADAITRAQQAQPDLIVILAGSATSDRRDVAPAAIVRAGGGIERFGMPVDPGNLLVLAHIGATPVIVLPGCARSPALNGADWVLERIAAGLDVGDADIASMGVGGLLKEIATRPEPRERPRPAKSPTKP